MKVVSLIIVLSIFCTSSTLIDPVKVANEASIQRNHPRVFIINENELLFEELSKDYETLMLAACNNDIQKAQNEWYRMLVEMQRYAALWNYYDELNGTKLWIKVFTDKRGRIQHIAYALKPSSKSIDTELFTKFLERFMRVHRMNIRTSSKFSHYTSVSFPIRKR